MSINILSQKFDLDGCITFSIRQSEIEQTLLELKAAILKISLEEALIRDFTEGVEISSK